MRTKKRRLRAESLESRQLLHGGALAGGGEPPTAEAQATEVVSRFDANEDMELSQDEVSERLWSRISFADGDENATISIAELTAHLEDASSDPRENENGHRNRRRGAERGGGRGGERISTEERIDVFFAENDTNVDGLITDADEVSEELLADIADADLDGDGVSADELLAQKEAQQEARAQARLDARFAALDDNGDGGITADEVSERQWERLSAADGEAGDGGVTAEELQTHLDARRAERQAEMEMAEEDQMAEETDMVEDNGIDEGNGEASEDQGRQRNRRGSRNARGRSR